RPAAFDGLSTNAFRMVRGHGLFTGFGVGILLAFGLSLPRIIGVLLPRTYLLFRSISLGCGARALELVARFAFAFVFGFVSASVSAVAFEFAFLFACAFPLVRASTRRGSYHVSPSWVAPAITKD
ncbi:MAG: hypothetical protein ACKPKO_31795, partial [Candidatus Fonsibacter sp.]